MEQVKGDQARSQVLDYCADCGCDASNWIKSEDFMVIVIVLIVLIVLIMLLVAIELKDDCGDCRMFKSMDCDNLKETSQKMIVDTFAPRRC